MLLTYLFLCLLVVVQYAKLVLLHAYVEYSAYAFYRYFFEMIF